MAICIPGEGAIGGWLATHAGHRISAEVQLIASDDAAALGPQQLGLKLRGTKFEAGRPAGLNTLIGAAREIARQPRMAKPFTDSARGLSR